MGKKHFMWPITLLISCQLFAYEVNNQLRDQILILSQTLGIELSNSIQQAEALLPDTESYLIDSNLPKPKWVSSSLKGIWMSGMIELEGSQSVAITDGTVDEKLLDQLASKRLSIWEYHPNMGLLVTSNWKGRHIVFVLDIESLSHQISFTKNDFASLWLLNENDQIILSSKSNDWGKQLAAELYTDFFKTKPQEDLWIGYIKGSLWSAYRYKIPGSTLHLLGLSKMPTLFGFPPQQFYQFLLGVFVFMSIVVLLWFRLERNQVGVDTAGENLFKNKTIERDEPPIVLKEELKYPLESEILEEDNFKIQDNHSREKTETLKPIKRRIKAMLPLPPNNLFSDQAIEQAIHALESLPEVDEHINPIGQKKPLIESPALGYDLDFEDNPIIDYQRPTREIDSFKTSIRKPGESNELNSSH